jgi:hypothetical protein
MGQPKVAWIVTILTAIAAFSHPSAASPAPKMFSGESTWTRASDWGSGADASPAFTPDGKTVYFTHGDGEKRVILFSHWQHGVWSAPKTAPFSGQWMDIEPAMAPDGSYLLFISNRPINPGGAPLDGYFGGAARPRRGGNLWRVDRVKKGWSQPVRLPDVVNSNTTIYAPAVAKSGNLYFMQPDLQSHKMRLYRSRFRAGTYEAPEPLSFSDGVTPDFDPVVAPDESFIIFSSGRPPMPEKQGGIFVVFSENQQWKTPVAFQPFLLGIETRLSPDLKTLYFTADRPTLDTATPTSQNASANPAPAIPQRIWQVPLQGQSAMAR